METNMIFGAACIGLIVWATILLYVIESATKSKKIERHLRIQSELLAKMALASGVEQSVVTAIIAKK